jgi:NitT/TauT family transport system permease protein
MSTAVASETRTSYRWLDKVLLLIGVAAIWQGLYAFAGDVAITSPLATVEFAIRLTHSDYFWNNAVASGKAFGSSLVISSIGGVAFGLMLGFHRFSGEVAEPMLTALYTIPKVTLYPLILLIFGLGISAKIAFGVIHGIIPVMLFTMSAVRAINPIHLRTARVLGLTSWQTTTTVLLPAVIPEVTTGLRVGFSLTLLGVLIGEMFASQAGLGFMIINGINTHDVETITAVILLLIAFAVLTNSLLLAVDRKLHIRV